MKIWHYISIRDYPPGGALFLLVGMLMLSACATTTPNYIDPAPLQNLSAAPPVEDVDVLAVTPEMVAFLDRYVTPYSVPITRLRLLTLAVTSDGVLGFDYNEDNTLTAAEAFRTRSGNCIGFANMMIALARHVGLEASYQEIYRRPEWDSRDDTLLLLKHINVVISSPRYSYVIDVSGVEIKKNERRRIVSDQYAKALYFNNLGADALIENELPEAWAYMTQAINTNPGLTDSWVNLGVVYGRNEQYADAVSSYKMALQYDGNTYSAMSNLYEIYLAQENIEDAELLQAKVERYREKNPFYLMVLSEESLEMGDFEESINLLERALKKKEDAYLLHYAMARTQYLYGDTEAAEISLLRVRELAPQDLVVHYDRPLKVIVLEDQAERELERLAELEAEKQKQ